MSTGTIAGVEIIDLWDPETYGLDPDDPRWPEALEGAKRTLLVRY